MKSKYLIRLANDHDLEALVNLEQVAFSSDRFTEDQIDYFLTASRATNFIVEKKSETIGGACMLWRKAHHSARLYNIAINPKFQGQGFGFKLLKECELEAAYRGCDKLTLEVRIDNEPAIKLYQQQGFKIGKTVKGYYEDGTAAYKMAKEIDIKVPDKVNLHVPYYHQSLDFTCGPACLLMALKYFYPETDITRALELSLWKESTLIFMAAGFGGTDGYGMAYSALSRGLGANIVLSMDTTPLLKSVRIPQKREVIKIVHNDLKKKAKAGGLGTAFYDFGIDEIVAALHRGLLPIVLISTYRLTGDKVPHWVVVTGFDKDNIYIHDSDLDSYKKNQSKARNLKVEKSRFLQMTRYGKEVYRCLLLLNKKQNH